MHKPYYPANLPEAIKLLQRLHDEDDDDSEYRRGHRQGLRIAIGVMKALKEKKRCQRKLQG